jgi:hypothetical protein
MNLVFRSIVAVVLVAVVLIPPVQASAPAGRYTSTGGTVFDTKTKLTWQQTAPAGTYTWANAKTYCQAVGASLGGTGWRLPTVKELVTVVDYSQTGSPKIDAAFLGTTASYYWSSSPVAGSPSAAWGVLFNGGVVLNGVVGVMLSVRCVR